MKNEFKDKKVTIFGAGKSGLAVAKKLADLGAVVFVSEANSTLDMDVMRKLRDLGVAMELGGHTTKAIENAELVIMSPGVHLDLPVLEHARSKAIPIQSEIELAYGFIAKPIIAVTGTNGKTTTTTLIGEMLKAEGKKAAVAGNIGNPLIEIDDSQLDYVVAEISSYQLESIDKFKPWISVILNIQPDHLERHHSMEEYIRQKSKIFMNQSGDDYIVYNMEDPSVTAMVKNAKARLIGFSQDRSEIITLPPEQIRLPGKHNLDNSLAAAQAAYLCGVKKDTVAEILKTFPGVEHRIEYVTSKNEIRFYNDSKGTNPDSTRVAIDTFGGKGIILILGGREKGVSLEPLAKLVKEQVKAVVLIGEAAPKFEEALRKAAFNKFYNLGFSLEEAVKKAFSLAEPGDIVLFSPACASFDMFKNYEERGKAFKTICLCLNIK